MQLLYPWFLLGLGAILVPVIIHLLELRRPQRVLFTNTAFINEVAIVTAKQRKLQHLLVLLLRIIVILALVLAFCQPFISAQKHRVSSEREVEVIVDHSGSMRVPAADGQEVLFAGAISGANALTTLYPTATRFRLNGSLALGSVPYGARVAELKLSAKTTGKLVTDNWASNGGASKSPLYILSDFQKKSFDSTAITRFGTAREVWLVPQVGKPVGNVYVDSVWFDDAFVRMRTNIGMHIRLRNGGSQEVADCPVKVFLGQQQVAAFRVTVVPGQAIAEVIQVQVPDGALAMGRVVTEDAPITFDNTYYFTLQAAATIKVVEIGNEPLTQMLYRTEPLFAYSFTKPNQVDYRGLREANLVLVREPPVVDAGLRAALQAVVARGGSVAVVPAATTAGHSSYQQLFEHLGVGAAQWETGSTPPEMREVALPNAQEPFFRDVFGGALRTVAMPHVAPVLHWARTGTDLLRLRDGESYLAAFASGQGKVYVFSAPFAKDYSDFTAHALFVPVMYRLAMLSYHSEQQAAYRLTQPAVTLALATTTGKDAASDKARFQWVRDSLRLLPAQRIQAGDVRLEVPAEMDQPGFYQVQHAGKALTTLAFNGDKKESELAAYSADELRRLVGAHRPNVRVLSGGLGTTALAQLQAERTGQPLWRYCLVAALVCLLAEGLVLRFGSQRVGPMPARAGAA